MHTYQINGKVRIHHNGDYSGNAFITVSNGPGPQDYTEVEVPTDGLVRFVTEMYRSQAVSLVESTGNLELLIMLANRVKE